MSENAGSTVHDIVILGGGSGGYACALRAAQLGLTSFSSRRASSAAPACTKAASPPRHCCTLPRSLTLLVTVSSSA